MPRRFWRIPKRSLAHAPQVLENSEEELSPCPSGSGKFSGEARPMLVRVWRILKKSLAHTHSGSGEFRGGPWPTPLRYWKIRNRSLAHAPHVLENSQENLGPCPAGIGEAWPMPLRFWKILKTSLAHAVRFENSWLCDY